MTCRIFPSAANLFSFHSAKWKRLARKLIFYPMIIKNHKLIFKRELSSLSVLYFIKCFQVDIETQISLPIDSWVKFQEDVEEGGKRWSKPFVPALQFTALAQLRHCLQAGVVMLDAPGEDLDEVIGEMICLEISEKMYLYD
jgi:hypothetical protein